MKGDSERLETTRAVCKELLSVAKEGDASAGFGIAHMLLGEGPSIDPELLLDIIEGILELSAHAGDVASVDLLNKDWVSLKKAHLKRLSRKLQT